MAEVTTFTRPRPVSSSDSGVSGDLTPSALGALGTVVVTEDAAVNGGARVAVALDAYSWTGRYGVALDPRTQRPFRVAPWVPAYPTSLEDLLSQYPLGAYMSSSATSYAGLLADLSASLGAWGWTSETTTT